MKLRVLLAGVLVALVACSSTGGRSQGGTTDQVFARTTGTLLDETCGQNLTNSDLRKYCGLVGETNWPEYWVDFSGGVRIKMQIAATDSSAGDPHLSVTQLFVDSKPIGIALLGPENIAVDGKETSVVILDIVDPAYDNFTVGPDPTEGHGSVIELLEKSGSVIGTLGVSPGVTTFVMIS